MRGYVLYDNGLRPYFKIGDNRFLDEDDFDLFSYHILAKIEGRIVGCVRLLPLSADLNSVTSQAVGKDVFRVALGDFLKSGEKLGEISRWIVRTDYTYMRIGYYLMYGALALGKRLQYKLIANAGKHTKDLVIHYGAVYLQDNFKSYYSEKYNDYVSILYFDKTKLSNIALAAIQKMEHLLGLMEPLKTPE